MQNRPEGKYAGRSLRTATMAKAPTPKAFGATSKHQRRSKLQPLGSNVVAARQVGHSGGAHKNKQFFFLKGRDQARPGATDRDQP